MLRLLYQCRTGPRTLSEMEAEPCSLDCPCWINKQGCKGQNSFCKGDTICQNNVCIKRPSNVPKQAPPPTTKKIVREYKSGTLYYDVQGVMFDVKAKSKPIVITNLLLTMLKLDNASNIQVYTRVGSHKSVSEKSNQWQGPIGEFSLNGKGGYESMLLPSLSIEPQRIGSGQTRAFYITSKNTMPFMVMEGSNYSNPNKPWVQNSDLKVLRGCSLKHKFNNAWGECKDKKGGVGYGFYGGFEYHLE